MRLAVTLMLALLAGCGGAPPALAPPPLVGTAPAMLAEGLVPSVTYVGTLAGEAEVDLAFKLAGRIELLGPAPGRDWREGDEVAAGQIIAALDRAELTEVVRAAEARAIADAALHERGARLMEDRLISQQDLDRLTATRDASAADLRKAQAALGDAVLAAPFAGTVLRRGARSGETVAAGLPVLRLADLARLSVELGVPEHVVSGLRPGQELALSISAFGGERLTGTVSEVGASAATGSRLFRLRIAVANADRRLRPGMSASVAIPGTPPPPGAVTVPLSALLADGDGRIFRVFTVDGGVARARPVEVLDVIASAAVVTGLTAGEPVVVLGAGLCSDGAPVAARPHDPDDLYRRP